MQLEYIIVLIIAIPVILFPPIFVWYLNIGGIYAAIKEARKRKATQTKYIGESNAIKSFK